MTAFAPKKIKGKSSMMDEKEKSFMMDEKENSDASVSTTASKGKTSPAKKYYHPSGKRK